MTETEIMLAKSVILARLFNLNKRVDRVKKDVREHRIGQRLGRYRIRLLERDCDAIQRQAEEWGVL